MNILQELYDSKISACIMKFWDAGFDWFLGPPYSAYRAKGTASTLAEAEAALAEAAIRHYPDSDFASRRKVPA